MRQAELAPAFVDDIPERLEEGRLYVSERHSLAMHLCCCGCRGEVVTPLSPAEWSLTVKNGKASLSPSVGNWGLPCRSHYWVRSNRIDWAGAMSDLQFEQVWARDRRDLAHQAAARNANLSIRRRAGARLAAAWKWVCGLFGQSG